MARGIPKADVHAVFSDRPYDLQDQAGVLADDIKAVKQRIWQIPKKFGSKRLTDVPKLHDPDWERTPINTNYVQCITPPPPDAGTVGDIISLKLQMDYNAVEERAFRMRHATITRSIILEHARRDGHKISNMFPFVVTQASNCIKNGAQADPEIDASGGPGTAQA
jgi:hypothetical protein